MQREDRVKTQGENATYTPRRGAPEGTHPASTWSGDLQPPDWEGMKVCCLSRPLGGWPSLWQPELTCPHGLRLLFLFVPRRPSGDWA